MSAPERISVSRALAPLLGLGLLAVTAIPMFMHASGIDPGPVPGAPTFLVTASAVTAIAGLVFRGLILGRARFTSTVFVLTMTFLGLVALVKFAYAPYSIYEHNQHHVFTYSTYLFQSGFSATPPEWVVNGAVVLLLYLAAWTFIGAAVERRRPWRPLEGTPRRRIGRIVGIAIGTIVGLALIGGGWFVVVMVVFATQPIEYLRILSVTPECIGISTVLAIAGGVAAAAYQSAHEQARALNNTTALASIFWIGAGSLLVYHALWVVYMVVLNATWPFRVEHVGK
jgi:hypothetical protein